jgi:hypothetical protein
VVFRTALLVAWANAWFSGQSSPDDLLAAVPEPNELSIAGSRYSLIPGLRRVQAQGCRALHLVLPRPGDPAGLFGHPDLLGLAIGAGAAAVTMTGAPLILVPSDEGWSVLTGEVGSGSKNAGDLPQLGSAERDFTLALAATTQALAALDLARETPEAMKRLAAATSRLGSLPVSLGNRAIRLAGTSTRVLAILTAAGLDDGAALTAMEIVSRKDALSPLDITARRAFAAAISNHAERLLASA